MFKFKLRCPTMHRLNSLQSSTALHTRIAGVRHLGHLGLTYLNDVTSTFVFDNLDVGKIFRVNW